MMTVYDFQLLGPVGVWRDGQPIDVGGPTARALLAELLLRGSAGVSTAELVSSVWGGPEEVSRASVYHYVGALRAALPTLGGRAVLEARRPGYRLVVEDGAVDWRRFRSLVGQARVALDERQSDRAAALLRGALDLWHGPPLAGLGDRLEPRRLEMERRRLAAVEELAAIEAGRGQPDRVLDLLSGELAGDPGRERAAALVVKALTQLGRRDEAGRVYRRARAHLAERLGLEPNEELEVAYRGSLGAAAAHRPDGPPSACVPPGRSACRRPVSGLPRHDRHFVGRVSDLDRLVEAVTVEDSATVCVVHGMAGVGKTALVARAAELLASRFPDGTVFIDLHGYTRGRAQVTAAEALGRVLRRIGVDAERIPVQVDERAAFYRDQLADRRLLIILDNAHDVRQVRPLLPGAPGCAVVITSRLRLAALDDACAIPLDVLHQAEAMALFRSIVGTDRLNSEPDADAALRRVVARCGRLPLAIRVAAARHRARHSQALADLDKHLADAHTVLTELDDGDRSVAASFQVSVAELPPELRRTFALLGTHPGAEFSAEGVGALVGEQRIVAASLLDRLVDRHLLVEHARGRYRFHDLVAVFAGEYARGVLPAGERSAALRRVADHYLRSAEVADRLITPHRYRVQLDVVDDATTLPLMDDYEGALKWLAAELANIADVCVAAGVAGLDVSCWQLAYTMRGYYFLTKNWQPWVTTHEAALAAARRSGDAHAEAITVNNLGLAHFEQGNRTVAGKHFEDARRLFARVDDPHGENTARANHAWILFAEHRFTEFLRETEPVLRFYRHSGAERNAGITLRGIGLAEAELGRCAEATRHLLEAMAVFTRLGLQLDSAMTFNGLGETYRRAGNRLCAVEAHTQALAISERCGSVFERARAHHGLGRLEADVRKIDRARWHWTKALTDYKRLGAPEAPDAKALLAELDV